MPFLVGLIFLAVATALVGRSKGSSPLLWFGIGFFLPVGGLIAAYLYRFEQAEPERRCEHCGQVLKLYVQVCTRCGADLYMPAPENIRPGPGYRASAD